MQNPEFMTLEILVGPLGSLEIVVAVFELFSRLSAVVAMLHSDDLTLR
jgi:uncharacterized protein involved in cysteine biosynthesis